MPAATVDTIRIGLVENEAHCRDRVQEIMRAEPRFSPIAAWESAEDYLQDTQAEDLDVILIDILLPKTSGIELARTIAERYPKILIIMVTNLNSEEMIVEALKAGARGYILKAELDDISHVLHVVLAGGAIITPTIAVRVMQQFRKTTLKENVTTLTTREKQILQELSTGMKSQDLADRLNISVHTLRNHIKNIYQKLSVSNRAQLFRRALDDGLI